MDIILKTNGLTKEFGFNKAVDHVNMTIYKGDIYGFIGKNGAGKTTFMRMVVGTALPSEGSIELFGGEELSRARSRIGSLMESPGIYSNCSAVENMKRFSILFGGSPEDIKCILDMVGLGDTGRKPVMEFSLGMKQRLGIAIALLGEPEFLVLDEPVNGLDPAGMREMRNLILKLNKEKNITFLISSHLLDELSKVVTKYGIINKGRLVEEISADELELRCQHKLRILVDDTEKAKQVLSQVLAPEEIETVEGAILISKHMDEGAELNQLLSKNDVLVSRIESLTDGLEEYFIERIGE